MTSGYSKVSLSDDTTDDVESRESAPESKLLLLPTVIHKNPAENYSKELFALCISYTVAAANEYWVVNWLKMYGVNLPIFFALVQNASWPVQYILYKRDIRASKEPRIISYAMYKSYLILGCLAAFISLTRMFGLSTLPPTLYVICANTEIVFETVMTRTILKRQISLLQYVGVFLVLAGVIVALYDPVNNTFGAGEEGTSESVILSGVGLSLASRLASSLNTILAEKFLGKDAKSKIGVSECSVANSVIPFFAIPFAFSWDNEYTIWKSELIVSSRQLTAIITLLCIALCVSKHIDRLSKFGIVSASSTIFFAGVDSAMKMIAGLGTFLFFGEVISWPVCLGFGLVGLSVIVLYFDKRNKKRLADLAALQLAAASGGLYREDDANAKLIVSSSPGRSLTNNTTTSEASPMDQVWRYNSADNNPNAVAVIR